MGFVANSPPRRTTSCCTLFEHILQQIRLASHSLWGRRLSPDVGRDLQDGYGNDVHIIGRRCDVDALLPAFDVFVLTSVTEGLPLALLQAQAYSIPYIIILRSNLQVGICPGLLTSSSPRMPLPGPVPLWMQLERSPR